jgi:hypothetical protein
MTWKKAFVAVTEKTMGALKDSKLSEVPRTVLQSFIIKSTLPPKQAAVTKLGCKTGLRVSLEEKPVKYISLMDEKFYG